MKTFDAKWESSCFSFHSPKKSLAFLFKMENKITTIAKKLDELVSTKGPRDVLLQHPMKLKLILTKFERRTPFLMKIRVIERETQVSNTVDKLLALNNQKL